MVLTQLDPQLLRPPMPPPFAQRQHRLHHRNIVRLAVPQWCMRALPQPRSALTAIPPEPLVAGLAADPILPAQRCHLILARQNPSDKLRPFVHLTGLSPRHRQAPLPPTVQTCHLSTRSTLLPIYPAHTDIDDLCRGYWGFRGCP